jgi:hypothetical protein
MHALFAAHTTNPNRCSLSIQYSIKTHLSFPPLDKYTTVIYYSKHRNNADTSDRRISLYNYHKLKSDMYQISNIFTHVQ